MKATLAALQTPSSLAPAPVKGVGPYDGVGVTLIVAVTDIEVDGPEVEDDSAVAGADGVIADAIDEVTADDGEEGASEEGAAEEGTADDAGVVASGEVTADDAGVVASGEVTAGDAEVADLEGADTEDTE